MLHICKTLVIFWFLCFKMFMKNLNLLLFDLLLLLQEAAALAATEVAFMLQAAQSQSLQFTIAPGPVVTPHQEPLQ